MGHHKGKVLSKAAVSFKDVLNSIVPGANRPAPGGPAPAQAIKRTVPVWDKRPAP
jgi:hypothetical protein